MRIKRICAGEYETDDGSIYISKSEYTGEWEVRSSDIDIGWIDTTETYAEARAIALKAGSLNRS